MSLLKVAKCSQSLLNSLGTSKSIRFKLNGGVSDGWASKILRLLKVFLRTIIVRAQILVQVLQIVQWCWNTSVKFTLFKMRVS